MRTLSKKVSDVLILIQLCAVFFSLSTSAFPTVYARGQQPSRWFYEGETAESLGQLLGQNDARLTKVRVQDPNVPTFTAAMVQNTGSFGSAWWWYYGLDANTLSSLLEGKRLISIDPYNTPEGIRYAVVMVPNTGAQDRAWWWWVGVNAAEVGQYLQQNNARIVDLRPYNDNGQLLFAVIMIQNTGADQKKWEWWYGESPEFINSRVQQGFRLLCFEPDPFGNFAAVLVENDNEGWYWYYGISAAQTLGNIQAHDTRLLDISPYFVNGNLEFTTVEIDNNLGPQDGSEI